MKPKAVITGSMGSFKALIRFKPHRSADARIVTLATHHSLPWTTSDSVYRQDFVVD